MEPVASELDLATELMLIRKAIERYRRSSVWSFMLSSLTVVALIVSVTVGLLAQRSDERNEARDRSNLIELVRTSCEESNDRATRESEALISTVSTPNMSAVEQERIDVYRENIRDTLVDCDDRVAIIAED